MKDNLRELISGLPLVQAPRKTVRTSEHYEFLIGIGNDETASIIMHKDAYEALLA